MLDCFGIHKGVNPMLAPLSNRNQRYAAPGLGLLVYAYMCLDDTSSKYPDLFAVVERHVPSNRGIASIEKGFSKTEGGRTRVLAASAASLLGTFFVQEGHEEQELFLPNPRLDILEKRHHGA
jgi:hypothetical protein